MIEQLLHGQQALPWVSDFHLAYIISDSGPLRCLNQAMK
jgi:hypothetical protein